MSNERKRPAESIAPVMAGFPLKLWEQWDRDCKENYGDCRWMKAWNDHLRARETVQVDFLMQEILELKAELAALKEAGQGKEKVKTLTMEIE